MKAVFTSVIVLFALVFSAMPAHAADMKIGTVNINKVLQSLPELEEVSELISEEFAEPIQRLTQLEEEFEALRERVARDEAIMTDDEKNEANQELRARAMGLQRSGEQLNQYIQMRETEERNRLLQKIYTAIEAYAEANGYDLILDYNRVPFSREAMDVSDQIIERLLD